MNEIEIDMVKEFIYKKDYNYVIYIKETITSYECYIQNESYGVISLMFGVNKKDCSLKEIEDLIESNIENYIEIYKQDYED